MQKLTKREKVLMAVLVLVLIAVGWFKLIYEPVLDKADALHQQTLSEQSETDALMPKVLTLNRMKTAVEELKADSNVTAIPNFDNSKPVMVALNKILLSAREYKIVMGKAVQDDYIYSRSIELTFSTGDYATARSIIDRLDSETYVNQISDVRISEYVYNDVPTVSVTLLLTFFELAE